jgi:PIN domain nuclease of toxin-antitoxin system
VDLELDRRGHAVPPPAGKVILLDTNAVIWLEQRHPRARPLLKERRRLYISPATLLELQFLHETARIRLHVATVSAIADDQRWLLDDPPAASWFDRAADLSWTRDPFDRLIAAHALVRRWRLATGDAELASNLGPTAAIEL